VTSIKRKLRQTQCNTTASAIADGMCASLSLIHWELP